MPVERTSSLKIVIFVLCVSIFLSLSLLKFSTKLVIDEHHGMETLLGPTSFQQTSLTSEIPEITPASVSLTTSSTGKIARSRRYRPLKITNFSTFIPNSPSTIDFHNDTTSSYRRLLTPIRRVDQEYYTIRVNTYQRHAQLALSVNHHISCAGVAQIQILWSEPGEPPEYILNLTHSGKVIFEYHQINSLNERFNIIHPTPTLGILSMDDDILLPCVAIDSAFFQWTAHSYLMVGVDARGQVEKGGKWFYRGDFRTSSIGYSMTLPRYCFLHRDYLHWYMTSLPREVFDYIARHQNCEDLAMSMFVTKLSGGERPLLFDAWARWTALQLASHNEISNRKWHRVERTACLNRFADPIGVREILTRGPTLSWNESYMDSAPDMPHPRYQEVKRQWEALKKRSKNVIQMRRWSKQLQLDILDRYQPLLEALNATHLGN